MKKKIMKAGILIVVFCAAVIISSLVINKDVSDEAADMGAASLPEISFYVGNRSESAFWLCKQDGDTCCT